MKNEGKKKDAKSFQDAYAFALLAQQITTDTEVFGRMLPFQFAGRQMTRTREILSFSSSHSFSPQSTIDKFASNSPHFMLNRAPSVYALIQFQ